MLTCYCKPKHEEFKFGFVLSCKNRRDSVPGAPIETLWEADPNLCNPNGTLIITYKDGCNKELEVYLNDNSDPRDPADLKIIRGQTHAITLNTLKRVGVRCKFPHGCDSKGRCCGTVCISLNYT
ncbi:DUF3992 domain-containing protein [Mycoplasmatota bacterium zrk1]